MSARPPLRVGVMLDALTVPAWIGGILRRLRDADHVDLRIVVVNAERLQRPPLPVRLWRNRSRIVYHAYEIADAKLYGRTGDPFTPDDVTDALAGVPKRIVVPQRPTPYEHRFDPEDLAALRAEDLDVVLRFGFGIIRGEILDVPRYGVWSYHHGDDTRYRGGPAGFWEMLERDPVSVAVLQILTDDLDHGHVIYRTASATDRASLRRGRTRVYAKTAHFMERRLKDLHEHGWEWIQQLDTFTPTPNPGPIRRTPTNSRMGRFLLRTWGGIAWRWLVRRFVLDNWFVAYRPLRRPPGPPVEGGGYSEVLPPRGHFYADPFLLERGGRTWLFVEDYDWALGRAKLVKLEIGPDGTPGPPAVVLDPPHHLSYPFVFEHDGEVLVLPESAQARRVATYRAPAFPDGEWELDRVLLDDVEAYDATLLEHDGRWWLFVAIPEPGASPDEELHLFHAPSLDGPWTPHPRNPVVSDVRSARPGGRIIKRDGVLLRPAQDGSVRYGAAIMWQQIDVLDTERYVERTVARTGRNALPRSLATHTYDHSPRWEVVDGQRALTRR